MALFKFRKGDDDRVATAAQPESVEVMRKRARHRLIGAAVLVLVAVIGFPMLFDTQPRPIAIDLPIDIPDRNKTKPLAIPVAPPAVAVAPAVPVVPPAATPAPKVTTAASLDDKEQVISGKPESRPAAKPEPKPEPKVVAKAEPRPEPKPEPKPSAKPDDGAKAKALLEGKSGEPATAAASTAAAVEGRFVVQIGAFADSGKAQEARQKVERTGLKTYTQVAETKDGKRIRVRVGPYANRAEAEKAASRIRGLDLPAAILTL
ncbi:MAG: SPOR domain-containing protein [Bdellovibrionales bacterium]|nr:SPOR domain-containing protein [Ramlibacter sp.]